jgi:hypothetical protein
MLLLGSGYVEALLQTLLVTGVVLMMLGLVESALGLCRNRQRDFALPDVDRPAGRAMAAGPVQPRPARGRSARLSRAGLR